VYGFEKFGCFLLRSPIPPYIKSFSQVKPERGMWHEMLLLLIQVYVSKHIGFVGWGALIFRLRAKLLYPEEDLPA
jgi:hypothetical protein